MVCNCLVYITVSVLCDVIIHKNYFPRFGRVISTITVVPSYAHSMNQILAFHSACCLNNYDDEHGIQMVGNTAQTKQRLNSKHEV